MNRGRKPLPAAIRELEGNPGHRPIPDCPTPEVRIPDPPPALSPAAADVWHRIGPKFAAMGVIAEVDELAFAMLCEAYANWLSLIELARKDGPVVRVNGQPVPNPFLTRADREGEKVRKLLVEFGGSPSSRTRLNAAGQPNTPGDDIESFLRLAE